jgi:hypothetical protein
MSQRALGNVTLARHESTCGKRGGGVRNTKLHTESSKESDHLEDLDWVGVHWIQLIQDSVQLLTFVNEPSDCIQNSRLH